MLSFTGLDDLTDRVQMKAHNAQTNNYKCLTRATVNESGGKTLFNSQKVNFLFARPRTSATIPLYVLPSKWWWLLFLLPLRFPHVKWKIKSNLFYAYNPEYRPEKMD